MMKKKPARRRQLQRGTGDRVIRGAKVIAEYVFGDPDQWRSIYPLKDELGLFMLGGMLAARTATLDAKLAEKESATV
jgi:hypothetical protein